MNLEYGMKIWQPMMSTEIHRYTSIVSFLPPSHNSPSLNTAPSIPGLSLPGPLTLPAHTSHSSKLHYSPLASSPHPWDRCVASSSTCRPSGKASASWWGGMREGPATQTMKSSKVRRGRWRRKEKEKTKEKEKWKEKKKMIVVVVKCYRTKKS